MWNSLLIVNVFEIIAAVSGIYYLKKSNPTKWERYFVYYLWALTINEIIGLYTSIAYFSEYKYFSFVEGTPFSANYWLYNITTLIYFCFLILYFRSLITIGFWRKLLKIALYPFVLIAVLDFIINETYFNENSKFVFFTGVLLLVISILVYYFELLKTDKIFSLKYNLSFYFSTGLLLFYVSIAPLLILSNYYVSANEEFVEIRKLIIIYGNIFLYSLISIGFLICSKKNRFSS